MNYVKLTFRNHVKPLLYLFKALASSAMTLFLLRVIPMFYANRKRSVEEIAKVWI